MARAAAKAVMVEVELVARAVRAGRALRVAVRVAVMAVMAVVCKGEAAGVVTLVEGMAEEGTDRAEVLVVVVVEVVSAVAQAGERLVV